MFCRKVSAFIPSFAGHPCSVIARKTVSALSSIAFVNKLEYFALFGGERSFLSSKMSSLRGKFSFKVLESCGSFNTSLRSARWVSLHRASLPCRQKMLSS